MCEEYIICGTDIIASAISSVIVRTDLFEKKKPFVLLTKGFSFLAAELGFEPRQTESESVVLPLHNSAIFISLERSLL